MVRPLALLRRALRRCALGAVLAAGASCAVGLAARPALAIDASIVVDAGTGAIVSAQNPDVAVHPASLTKMMTLFLTFEAIERGRITLSSRLPVSAYAANQSPTKLGLKPGQTITTEQAILGLVTESANDAAVVLAEALGGDVDRFAAAMTQRAHQIGMTRTTFRNPNGLPNDEQVTTARDFATLAAALLQTFPQYYHYFSTRAFAYGGKVHNNHNHLMERYEGMDGLKTGYIRASGFNLAASAVRDGRRLIAVVFGGTSAYARDVYMAGMLDDGFDRAAATARSHVVMASAKPHLPQIVSGFKPDVATARRPGLATASTVQMAAAAPAGVGDLLAEGDAAGGVGLGDEASALPVQPARTVASLAEEASASRTIAPPQSAAPQAALQAAPAPVRTAALPAVVQNPAAALPQATPLPMQASGTLNAQLAQRGEARVIARKAAAPKLVAVQLGSYKTKEASLIAARAAEAKVAQLKTATVAAEPVKTKQGTVWRTRIVGLNPETARLACKKLPHCEVLGGDVG